MATNGYPQEVKCVAGNKREPISHEIMNFVERLANQAEKTAGRASEKLAPICVQPCPTTNGGEKISREYPPLFSDMRDRLITIETALTRLNDVLDRAEV